MSFFLYYHCKHFVGLDDPPHEYQNYYLNSHLVHTLICLIICSFLHDFNQICISTFPMYALPDKQFQHKANTLIHFRGTYMHVDSIHNLDPFKSSE